MTGLLLDHLWQSTLFAAAAALLALALRRNAARVRFWVWFAAAAKFLVPFALIAWMAAGMAARLHAQAPASPRLELARQVLAPMTAPAPAATIRPVGHAPPDPAPWLGAAWMLGTGAILARRAVQWAALTRALAEAAPLAVPAPLPVVVAQAKGGPAVVGFLRPVLALPPGLTEHLTPAELEAVLEHELHHARRRDNLLVLPLLLAQALFWFHPLIWWIGRRLMAERERACDEAVVAAGIDPETYARGLLEACRLELAPAPILAAAAAGGSSLKQRIRRIMADRPPRPLGARGGLALTLAATTALALPVLAGVFTAAPAATARVLQGLARPIAAATAPPAAGGRNDPAAGPPSPLRPVKLALVSAPAALTEAPAYAPQAEALVRLTRRTPTLAFPSVPPEAAAALPAPAIQTADAPPSSSRADLMRALADRTAYVDGVGLGGARLGLRAAAACPTAGVADAERRLGEEVVSTAFDGRVRRFVDEALAGKVRPKTLTPAMASAVDRALPVLQPALAARFGGSGTARLIGEDRQGHDVYLVRAGDAGYALVLVDDLGQIAAAMFCAGG
jgi:beta-lactamase regulating signal transducer with metallopeptidase domain